MMTHGDLKLDESLDVDQGRSLWSDGFRRLKKDKIAVICFTVIVLYTLTAIAAKMGWIASGWNKEVGGSYEKPSFDSILQLFGTDFLGRSVLLKTIMSAKIAMSIGLFVCVISITIGVILGAIAGYFGGWVDDLIVWFYTTVSSIPYILLITGIAFVMGKGFFAVFVALGISSWVGLARVIRGEFIKHKNREYVLAATSIGASHFSRVFKHIFPNVTHQIIIYFSLLFQSAIKAEVILSYLGIGVQGHPSWGIMIDDARTRLATGVWWELAAATMAMFFLVLAFNLLGDAFRDALDPKLKV